jgi:hypothetical protein
MLKKATSVTKKQPVSQAYPKTVFDELTKIDAREGTNNR